MYIQASLITVELAVAFYLLLKQVRVQGQQESNASNCFRGGGGGGGGGG